MYYIMYEKVCPQALSPCTLPCIIDHSVRQLFTRKRRVRQKARRSRGASAWTRSRGARCS